MVKYRVLGDIAFEPVDRDGIPIEECHRHYTAGDTFTYPDDVTCPEGQTINIEFLLSRGIIEEQRRRSTWPSS